MKLDVQICAVYVNVEHLPVNPGRTTALLAPSDPGTHSGLPK